MKTLPGVSTYTAVITASSHSSGRGALGGLSCRRMRFHHPPPPRLHLSSPWEVSTFMEGGRERDGNLGCNSAGPAHGLKQRWTCVGAKMLDGELWYRHTTFCTSFMLVSITSSRKYLEKHCSTTLLRNVQELTCQSPCFWKRGIGRNTNHKPEGYLLTKHPGVVQNQY